MKQYTSIKAEHEDAILLFRLGDFYEMFGPDARVASGILQIALTTRDKNKDEPMPMCGIPYFAAENYIARLIKAGHKVAICEQVEDPKDVKGIVRREVVRVITPGTHAPDDPKQNTFLMAILPSGAVTGIAIADVSTGQFTIYETGRPLFDEITRFGPAEVVIPLGMSTDIHIKEALANRYVSTVEDYKFDQSEAYKTLLRHFKVASLEGFGCEGMDAAVSAGGALVAYLAEAHHSDVTFKRITTVNQATYMFIDAPTQRNLELVTNLGSGTAEGTLLWALDHTLTPMGGRLMRQSVLRPLIDREEIEKRQRAVQFLVEDYELIDTVRFELRSVLDIERLAQRVSTGRAAPREMQAIASSVKRLPRIKQALKSAEGTYLAELSAAIGDMSELEALINASIVDHPPATLKDGGVIRKGYNAEVDELRGLSVNARDYIAALEAEEKKKTGISTLKVGFNRIHGYYIEVTRSNLDLAPERYVRKQTLVGAERFITPELKDYESRVLGAEDRLKALESEIFTRVVAMAAEHVAALMQTAESLAHADYLASLATIAKRNNYVRPVMIEDSTLVIKDGRHPVIEKLEIGEAFIPNDTEMDGSRHRILIITGPNMAGKSTYMRQVALITLMAQMGGFVPAESAEIGIVDRIFTRIGASDYLTRGQSTFMVEMVETANILNNATARSLILLDEVGRGTSTFDGISIAWATAEYIGRHIMARTLFATHYNELTDLVHRIDGARNLNVQVKEWGEEVIFLRKIAPGPADKSYGIQVARLAGLPDEVLRKAREVLVELEKQHMGSTANFSQMDLFAPREEVSLKEFLDIDTKKLTPEEIAGKVRMLQDRARGSLF